MIDVTSALHESPLIDLRVNDCGERFIAQRFSLDGWVEDAGGRLVRDASDSPPAQASMRAGAHRNSRRLCRRVVSFA